MLPDLHPQINGMDWQCTDRRFQLKLHRPGIRQNQVAGNPVPLHVLMQYHSAAPLTHLRIEVVDATSDEDELQTFMNTRRR